MRKIAMIAAVAVTGMTMTLMAEPGNGIHSGPWMFSPYVNLAGTYDSNVNKAPSNPDEDFFLDSEAGLKLGYSTYLMDVSGLGFLSSRNYSDMDENDFTSGGEVLKFKHGTHDTVVLELSQSFRSVEDLDSHGSESAVMGVSPDSVLDASGRASRDINNLGISAGRNLTDKLTLDAGYRFDDVKYSDSALYDLQSHMVQAETAHRLTDKSDALVTLQGGMQDNGVIEDAANYYVGRVGMKTRGTDKLIFKGGVGVQVYDRTDDDLTSLSYDLAATWLASDKIVVQAGGRNGTVLSSFYTDNVSEYNSLWLGSSYAIVPKVVLSGNLGFRQDDYQDEVMVAGESKNRTDDGVGFRVRADYLTPAKFMRVYTEALYENVDSTAVSDYDETRVTVGLNLQY